MAYTFDVNELPATGSLAMYQHIANLIAAGWTKVSDSDGTTYSAGGTQVTGGGGGAHGFGNTSAWVRLRCPVVNGNAREIVIQRSSGSTQYRTKYSAAAGFSGGAPSATQVPSATDEVLIHGSGSDGAPGFQTVFATDNSYRCHSCAGGAGEGYAFYLLTIATGGFTSIQCAWFMDTLQAFDVGDPDPTWWFFTFSSSNGGRDWANAYNSLPTSGGSGAWLGATSSSSNFVPTAALSTGHPFGQFFPYNGAGSGQAPFSTKDPAVPIAFGRSPAQAAPFGLKGWSTMLYWTGVGRAFGDTMDISGTADRLWYGGAAIPWNGSVPLN